MFGIFDGIYSFTTSSSTSATTSATTSVTTSYTTSYTNTVNLGYSSSTYWQNVYQPASYLFRFTLRVSGTYLTNGQVVANNSTPSSYSSGGYTYTRGSVAATYNTAYAQGNDWQVVRSNTVSQTTSRTTSYTTTFTTSFTTSAEADFYA